MVAISINGIIAEIPIASITETKTENIETSILKKKIDYNEGDDEDNLLEGFEEEVKDLDTFEEDTIEEN